MNAYRFLYIKVHRATQVDAIKASAISIELHNVYFSTKSAAMHEICDKISCVFEKEPLSRFAEEGQLMSYAHTSFWQCMDTKPEKDKLERLWQGSHAPWKVWAE